MTFSTTFDAPILPMGKPPPEHGKSPQRWLGRGRHFLTAALIADCRVPCPESGCVSSPARDGASL